MKNHLLLSFISFTLISCQDMGQVTEQAEAAGVEIIYSDKEPFIERVQPLYDEYRQDNQLWELIGKIRAKE